MSYSDVLSIFSGALTTLLLSVAGIALGLPIGLGMALLRWGRLPAVGPFIAVYVSLLRASPLVTLLLLLFYGLPDMGIEIGPIAAGVLATATLFASGSAGAQQKMAFKASDVHPAGYPTVVAVENLGKKLSAATNGRLTVATPKMRAFVSVVPRLYPKL